MAYDLTITITITWYKNQVRSILSNDLLSLNTPERITACNRCANSINRNKVPSVAFWNKMTVLEPPDQLRSLSEVELRLVSRIVPFIKIKKKF